MKEDENPFVVSGRIKPEYFCDREQESARLIKLLRNGNNVVVRSERRMGKTGLIQYCFNQTVIADNYYTFFIDILHTTCLQELVYDLGRAVYDQTVPYGKRLTQNSSKHSRVLMGNLDLMRPLVFPRSTSHLATSTDRNSRWRRFSNIYNRPTDHALWQ